MVQHIFTINHKNIKDLSFSAKFFEFISHARETNTKTQAFPNVWKLESTEDHKKLRGGRLFCALTGQGQLMWSVYTGQLLGALDPSAQPCKHCTSYLEVISPAVCPQH